MSTTTATGRAPQHSGPPPGGPPPPRPAGRRAAPLIFGLLLLQVGFVVSAVGAFHSAAPHRLPITVAAPVQTAARMVDAFDALPGDFVRTTVAPDSATARTRVLRREAAAAYIAATAPGQADTLLVASAAGPATAQAATQVAREAGRRGGRTVTVTDVQAPSLGDRWGLAPSLLAISWVAGGCLAAVVLLAAGGARPDDPQRTVTWLAILAGYAAVSGLAGAAVVDPVFGALPGHFAALCAIGALTVFAAGITTLALRALFGVPGLGLAALLLVVLGVPGTGGLPPTALLPQFWRTVGPALPTGAADAAVRNTVYFGGHATLGPRWVLGTWAVAGTVLAMSVSLSARRGAQSPGRHRAQPRPDR
ncbi:DUF3533 domain-containing protein [Actinomadura craniellae]|uniref:DUF3533 domain-containing protein n=1 Tax=Actinomadura craniellae TaxID=2231787 RepID=A0A365GY08_9ACTN|nr:DUF3533 domain-containing protein [Actinomadura craniellae]RAY11725.1 DUF3533 domain-containing protein [Actinomadura craniellae]